MNLRVLMLNANPVWRGTFFRALHFGCELVARGHQVTLLTVSRRGRWGFHSFIHDGVVVVETPDLLWGKLRSGWDIWNMLRRIQWLRPKEFDLVHAFDCRPVVIFPALYMKRRGVKLVLDWADWFGRGGAVTERREPWMRAVVGPLDTFFEERFRHYADATTVINNVLRQRAIELGIPAETILRLPHGCDVGALQVLNCRESRAYLKLPQDVPLIGYLGAIFHSDAQLMFEAFDLLRRELPQARLVLIGQRNLPLNSYISDPEVVIESGWVSYSDLNRYLAACDILWLPLRDTVANRGRWPSKLNDYLAAGRPVVATAVGDLTELFQAYRLGRLARDEPAVLAAQVVELMRSPAEREECARVARRVAEDVLAWPLLTAKLEALYQAVLDGRVGLTNEAKRFSSRRM